MSENNANVFDVAAVQPPLPQNPKFPEGLRVLLVDDSLTCLKTTPVLLERCKYHVTTVTNATEALALLRMNQDDYDIVMIDVQMPEMGGFELLKIIRTEMDIPMIMISAEDSTEFVMKGVQHGARDYLVKPLRIFELKNIWQHVMRKIVLNPDKLSLMTHELNGLNMGNFPLKKRRSKGKEKEDVNALCDNASVKKRRFTWTKELHRKFVETVHHLDAEKAVPKQIVEIMNEPGLTREIVASHLQKYRNFLKKEQDRITAEERNFDAGQKGTHEAYFTSTPNSYSLPMFREANSGCGSGSGLLSLRGRLPEPEPLSNRQLTENFMVDSLNQPSPWSQHNYNPSLAQSWGANPSARPMFKDYDVDMSSPIPSMGNVQTGLALGFAGQSGHSGFPPSKVHWIEHASHSGPPGVFGIAGAAYQMLDGTSTQMSYFYHHNNALPGQNDERVISAASFNGGVGSDGRGYPVDFQAMDKSRVNGQGEYTKLLTGPMDSNLYNSLSSMDDEIFTQGQQSAPTSAPARRH